MGERCMADFGNIEVDGFVKQREELEKLLMSNPAMEKKVQGLIKKVLMEVRRHLGEDATKAMDSDPRQAYKAVKTTVYRQILGGNVSILSKKRKGVKFSDYEPIRTLVPGQRGGNRKKRSDRSEYLLKYAGSDRGFVLRFIDGGTRDRGINFTPNENRKVDKWNKHPNTGFRGRIAPRNFFGTHSHSEMEQAAQNLLNLIDILIQEEFNK